MVGRASKSTSTRPEGVDMVVRHDKSISRMHAAIVYDEGTYTLKCLGKCRVLVDGQRCRPDDAPAKLANGSMVELGKHSLQLVFIQSNNSPGSNGLGSTVCGTKSRFRA